MDMGGWDLEAVVRGCRGAAKSTAEADPFSFLPFIAKKEDEEEEDESSRFLSEVFPKQIGVIHELEELCKPFFTKSPAQQPQKPQLSPQKTCSPPSERQIRQPQAPSLTQAPRTKRRKNQQKKVVRQAPAEGPSDMWAWRKYGQKPIKGSPYPRGYYRCSSSKGCFARKQVERSRTEPDKLIITYTGEHNHPAPAHRNSLAGSTRHKFSSSSSSSPTSATNKTLSSDLSPSTLTSSIDDELLFPQRSGEAEEDDEDDDDDENLLFLADMEILKDDDFLFSPSPASPVDSGHRLTYAVDDLGVDFGIAL